MKFGAWPVAYRGGRGASRPGRHFRRGDTFWKKWSNLRTNGQIYVKRGKLFCKNKHKMWKLGAAQAKRGAAEGAAQFVTKNVHFWGEWPQKSRQKLLRVGWRQRIQYKLGFLVYKCLRGDAPSYLTDNIMISRVGKGSQRLRSAVHGNLAVLQTRTVRMGPRSFAVSSPTLFYYASRIKNYANLTGIF